MLDVKGVKSGPLGPRIANSVIQEVSQALCYRPPILSPDPPTAPGGGYGGYAHLTDENTELREGEECVGGPSANKGMGWGLNPGLSDSEACALRSAIVFCTAKVTDPVMVGSAPARRF